jgi:hypothetical protein
VARNAHHAPHGSRRTGISADGIELAAFGKLAGLLVLWWGWTPLVYGLGYSLRYVTPGHKAARTADEWFYANYLVLGGWAWIWLTIGFIGTAVIAIIRFGSFRRSVIPVIVIITALVLAVAAFVQTWRVLWDNDKDVARYYDRAAVFYAPSLNGADAPPSLDRLLNGARPPAPGTWGAGAGCALVGASDVPGCVKQGTLPATGWTARLSSYNGAIFAISRTSGDTQNVSLSDATVSYLNAWHGKPARWSGILDGTGISQGMGGVAEWNGATVTTCDFTGQWAIDRSFGGSNDADLPDYLAQEYPSFNWTMNDVWGYCDGSEPIVVIDVTKTIKWMSETVQTAAGVIVVTGDYGRTHLQYIPNVRPGQFPGSVYARSLVDAQLTESKWAAGRGSRNNGGFGYVPTDSAAQQGHVSDYVLADALNGRLDLVTPLTLRHSSSQLFVAYAVTPADTVTDGQLNQMSIYVLAPGDPRQINVDSMQAQAQNWLAQNEPGFISSGGKLLEFTPVAGNMWRAYGELNGRVVYLLDIDATGQIAPALTSVASPGPGSPGSATSATAICGKPLTSLTTPQITFCLRQFANQLSQREGEPSSP